jgi:GT2 family glycosyltransferase
LNNDTKIITKDWIEKLIGIAALPKIGCVGAKLLYPDDSVQHAGVVMGLGGYAAHSHRRMKDEHSGYFNRPHLIQNVSAVTGACLVIRKEIYLKLGGLDEAFQVAYNDVDFCLRVQSAGYENVYCPEAKLYHFESKSRGDDHGSAEKRKRFEGEKLLLKERWSDVIENDPFYSPHLTRDKEDFTLRDHYGV